MPIFFCDPTGQICSNGLMCGMVCCTYLSDYSGRPSEAGILSVFAKVLLAAITNKFQSAQWFLHNGRLKWMSCWMCGSSFEVIREPWLLEHSGFANSNKDTKDTMIICLSLAKAGKMESHSREGFISQALKLRTALPPMLHSLELSHMAHLTAGEVGTCMLTVSFQENRTWGLVDSQPVSATLILETAEMLLDLWMDWPVHPSLHHVVIKGKIYYM